MKRNITIVAALFFVAAAILWHRRPSTLANAGAPQPAQVGVNLNALNYYGAFSPRLNLADQLGHNDGIWDTPDGTAAAKTNADGSPLENASAMIWQPMLDFGEGEYTISFAGSGALLVNGAAFRGAVPVKVRLNPAEPQGRGFLRLEFRNIDPANPPRDLYVLPPGVAAADRAKWNPAFLEKLKPFACLRTMDWTRTNNSDVVSWSDRVPPSTISWCAGVPWESIIDLANVTSKDLWINVPAKADDDYISHLAALFAERLNEQSHLYVEYSNECWNSQFTQEKFVRSVAAAANPELTQSDAYGRAGQQVAFKTRQIGNAFLKAFGGRAGQIRPVLCGQAGNPWALGEGLDFLKAHYGSTAPLYAIGVAPYVRFDDGTDRAGMSADDAFASLRANLQGACATAEKDDLKIARRFKLPMLGYEGGNELYALDGKNAELKQSIQRDSRMGQLYTDYFKQWQANGGGLLNHYALAAPPSKWGSWGLLENLRQKSSPKWDAVMNFIASAPSTQPAR